MYTPDVITVIPAAMKFHAERAEMQEAAAQLLVSVAAQGRYTWKQSLSTLSHSYSCLSQPRMGMHGNKA